MKEEDVNYVPRWEVFDENGTLLKEYAVKLATQAIRNFVGCRPESDQLVDDLSEAFIEYGRNSPSPFSVMIRHKLKRRSLSLGGIINLSACTSHNLNVWQEWWDYLKGRGEYPTMKFKKL